MWLIFLWIAFIIDFGVDVHDIHVSKVEIAYDVASERYQMACKIFFDDLEFALAGIGADSLNLFTDGEAEDANTYITKYIQDHVLISDGANWSMIGKEVSEDLSAIWCYLEMPRAKQKNEVKIVVNLLMELYDDQRNIISVDGLQEKRLHYIFDSDDHHAIIDVK